MKILVVDDDPDVRRLLDVWLKANRYDTCFAADVRSAIVAALKDKPDLIILDLGLPGDDGFGGMEKFKAIPALGGIPIVVLSAHDAPAIMKRAMEAGVKAFLQKPVHTRELVAAVRQALELAQPENP
jgi:two-component system KDP operon response regulator KdpE